MNIKKLFSVAAVVTFVGSTFLNGLALAATPDTELGKAYEWAYSKSVTTMDSYEKANMYGKITRAELAKMLVNWAKSSDKVTNTVDTTKTCEFTDTETVKGDLAVAITESCQMGLMGQFSDGVTTFRPYDTITRAEFGTALSRALWGNKYEGGTPWYKNHLEALKAAGIMTQTANAESMLEVRGYVMLMLMRVEGTDIADKGNNNEENNGKEENTNPGYVMVTGKAAADQEVALNAVNKKVGTITLTAGDNDTKVSSVVVKRSGLGSNENVSVQLFNDGVAATSQKYVSKSSQEATLKLSPAVVVKAKSSVTFDVVASLSGEVNETHTFSVTAVNVANGKAEGTPVELGTLKTTSYKVGEVKVELSNAGSLKAGETDKSIVTVKVIPSKKGTINGITITKEKGEDLDKLVSNVKAYYNDEVVGTVKVTDEKIVISNLNIERTAGQSASIELRGDCIYVGENETADLKVDVNEVLAVESNTNENMRCGGTTTTSKLEIGGANLKVTNKTTKEQTVVPGKSDVELLNVEVTSKTELEIVDYVIKLTEGDLTTGNFVDGIITLYIDGEDYEMDKATFTGTKKESFIVDANNPVKIRAVANLTEGTATGASYKMSVTLSGAKATEGSSTISLNKSTNGHTTKVKGASVVVKSASSSSKDNSLFADKDGQEIGSFSLKASNDDVTIKSLTMSLTGSASEVTGDVLGNLLNGNIKLFADGQEIEDVDVEDISGGVIEFKSMNYKIAKDKNVTIKVTADLGNIDEVLGKTLKLVLDSLTFKTATTSIEDLSVKQESKEYKFKATSPMIEVKKTSKNMLEVVIKNETSYDSGIDLVSLKYTVKSLSQDDFTGDICMVDDANTTSCETADGQLGKAGATYNFSGVNLASGEEKSYWIVVDGENITPDVLEATISTLKYKVGSDDFEYDASITTSFN